MTEFSFGIFKFNPYRDAKGRFASRGASGSSSSGGVSTGSKINAVFGTPGPGGGTASAPGTVVATKTNVGILVRLNRPHWDAMTAKEVDQYSRASTSFAYKGPKLEGAGRVYVIHGPPEGLDESRTS